MSVVLRRTIGYPPVDPDGVVVALGCRSVSRWGRTVRLAPIPFRMMLALLARAGRFLSHDDLFDFLYGGREDGGPERGAVRVSMHHLRKCMTPLGIGIESWHGNGYRAHLASRPAAMIAREAAP